jgi:hypothetical protein
MCDPISMAATTAVTSAASSVLGFIGQGQAYKANLQAANVGYAAKTDALNDQVFLNLIRRPGG